VRDLRDRENEHQIEQEFGIGDARMLVRHDRAIQCAALTIFHHGVPRFA
jgi:hypothetical protein